MWVHLQLLLLLETTSLILSPLPCVPQVPARRSNLHQAGHQEVRRSWGSSAGQMQQASFGWGVVAGGGGRRKTPKARFGSYRSSFTGSPQGRCVCADAHCPSPTHWVGVSALMHTVPRLHTGWVCLR